MIKIKHVIITLVVSLVLLAATGSHANEEIERENLALFIKEIDFLMSEADRIQKLSNENNRMIFDYMSLKNDLASMRRGISGYINKDINDGRVMKPLKGQY